MMALPTHKGDREYQKFKEDGEGSPAVRTIDMSGLVPEGYDYVDCSYTGSNLTGVVYKKGGAAGTVVATLTIAYDGSDNVETITRT